VSQPSTSALCKTVQARPEIATLIQTIRLSPWKRPKSWSTLHPTEYAKIIYLLLKAKNLKHLTIAIPRITKRVVEDAYLEQLFLRAPYPTLPPTYLIELWLDHLHTVCINFSTHKLTPDGAYINITPGIFQIPTLRHLTLHQLHEAYESDTYQMPVQCSNITHLFLKECVIGLTTIQNLLGACKALQSISIVSNEIPWYHYYGDYGWDIFDSTITWPALRRAFAVHKVTLKVLHVDLVAFWPAIDSDETFGHKELREFTALEDLRI